MVLVREVLRSAWAVSRHLRVSHTSASRSTLVQTLARAPGVAVHRRQSGANRFAAPGWQLTLAALPSPEDLDAFVETAFDRRPQRFPTPTPEGGWVERLRESNRNAIAHAVRRTPDQQVRDPDDPIDRARLAEDSDLLKRLLVDQVDERWPSAVTATGLLAPAGRPSPGATRDLACGARGALDPLG